MLGDKLGLTKILWSLPCNDAEFWTHLLL